jgi:transcriptional regulator with XRE-family HTH domain
MARIQSAIEEAIEERPDLPSPAYRRAIRKQAGLSQKQVADAIGASRELIAKFEQGRDIRPDPTFAAKYAEALQAMAEAGAE